MHFCIIHNRQIELFDVVDATKQRREKYKNITSYKNIIHINVQQSCLSHFHKATT